MNGQIFLGTFNAETFWANPDVARLPSINENSSRAIVYCMDELLAVMCRGSKDVLVTRFPLDSHQLDYFGEIGINFTSISSGMGYESLTADSNSLFRCVSSLIMEQEKTLNRIADCLPGRSIAPYAVTPPFLELAQKLSVKGEFPSVDVTRQVNSKVFSTCLSREALGANHTFAVDSTSELRLLGNRLLDSGSAIMLKEDFGVSGKGNFITQTKEEFERLCSFLTKQEARGKQVLLVVEKILDRDVDFSSHWAVHRDGTSSFIGVQRMMNHGLAFGMMKPLPGIIMEMLKKGSYFEELETIVNKIAVLGYHGPVCVDSMILMDGTVIPVVEINARISMGLINNKLNEILEIHDLESAIFYIAISIPRNLEIDFSRLLHILEESNLLFNFQSRHGFVVLSSNAVFINLQQKLDGGACLGRLFLAVVSEEGNQLGLIDKLKAVITRLGISVI